MTWLSDNFSWEVLIIVTALSALVICATLWREYRKHRHEVDLLSSWGRAQAANDEDRHYD